MAEKRSIVDEKIDARIGRFMEMCENAMRGVSEGNISPEDGGRELDIIFRAALLRVMLEMRYELDSLAYAARVGFAARGAGGELGKFEGRAR